MASAIPVSLSMLIRWGSRKESRGRNVKRSVSRPAMMRPLSRLGEYRRNRSQMRRGEAAGVGQGSTTGSATVFILRRDPPPAGSGHLTARNSRPSALSSSNVPSKLKFEGDASTLPNACSAGDANSQSGVSADAKMGLTMSAPQTTLSASILGSERDTHFESCTSSGGSVCARIECTKGAGWFSAAALACCAPNRR